MKKNKLKNFIKENFLFLLFLIPISLFFLTNRSPDNDIWFLLNSGRYILNNGFPTIEPFTIHEGLNIIMNQWLSTIIYYSMYRYLTKYFLMSFIVLIGIITMFLYYKLCYEVSNNKKLSIIITTICFILLKEYIVTRPQIFTYMILIIELLFLEKYVKSNNIKYLYSLPILSLLLINLHGVMWVMQFAFYLPFIINSIKIKDLNIEKYKTKPLLVTAFISFIIGFINPYSYKMITIFLNSYGSNKVNELIGEMNYLSFGIYTGKIVFFIIVFLILILSFLKKCRLDIRHYLLICGTLLLTFMHNKGYPYFIIAVGYSICYYLKKYKYEIKFKNAYIVLKRTLYIVLIFVIPLFIYISYNCYAKIFYSTLIKESVDYLLDNYDKDKIVLFTEYDDGGYTEYRGIKSYIDPRAEVFLKSYNKKEDIFDEYYRTDKMTDEEFEEFFNKYHFTHILVIPDTNIDNYLSDNEKYTLLYEQNIDNDDEYIIRKIYIPNNRS